MKENAALRKETAFLVFTLLASLHFAFLRATQTFTYAAASPEALVSGQAPTPYQYRVLMPLAAHALPLPPAEALRLLEFSATLGLFYATRALLRAFLANDNQAMLLTLAVAYILPFNFTNTFHYPWDITSLLFTTLCLLALRRQAWGWYYLLFIIATFNRETTYLLTLTQVFYALFFLKTPLPHLVKHVLAQASLWLAIKTGLFFAFRHNPAQGLGLFEVQLLRNLQQLSQPGIFLLVLRNWGMVWVFLLLWHKHIQDAFIRSALLAGMTQMLILLTVGIVEEMRIYGELIPALVLALSQVTAAIVSPQPQETQRRSHV